ncbi:hypothetical protein IJJ27_03630 [bacterium]|nr:hypothetical protein [bacterium]MBQ6436620.1 hypothetical protein [bacterium]
MDQIIYQHGQELVNQWSTMPFHLQMGNIGSEVSRALKAQIKGKQQRMLSACYRGLELFDLAINAACDHYRQHPESGRLKELCRAREEFCDYFFADNSWGTDSVAMQRYYDQFVTADLHS